MNRNRGFVLVAVLWIVVVLGILAYGLHNTAILEAKTTHNHLEMTRAKALADAGIETAIAVLLEEDNNDYDSMNDSWANDSGLFQETTVGDGGAFIIYGDSLKAEDALVYGAVDEERKININVADEETLSALPGMTRAKAKAIIDWRDDNNRAGPMGAENAYYLGLAEPYRARNGAFESIRELLLVKGFDQAFLFGEDANHNGRLDPAENDGDENAPPDDADGELDRGLSCYITLWSYARNVDGDGLKRLNVNKATEEELKTRLGGLLDDAQIKAVVKKQRKGEKNVAYSSIIEVISDSLAREDFIAISDKIGVNDEEVFPGRVNVNTAPMEVLRPLFPEEKRSVAKEVIERRESEGPYEKIGDLLEVDGVDESLFKHLESRLCIRSNVFTIRSVGYRKKSEALAMTEAVIDRGSKPYKIKQWRNPR